jgi:hypothetical protein
MFTPAFSRFRPLVSGTLPEEKTEKVDFFLAALT